MTVATWSAKATTCLRIPHHQGVSSAIPPHTPCLPASIDYPPPPHPVNLKSLTPDMFGSNRGVPFTMGIAFH